MRTLRLWGGVVVVLLASIFGFAAQEGEPTMEGSNSSPVASAVPRLVRFSGVLRDLRGEPLSGLAVQVTFGVYENQESGATLWSEAQDVELDEQGRYTVLLGATRADGLPISLFPGGEARWLGVQVEGRDEEPRVLLVSVPYALKAEDAEKLGGRRASEFVLAEQLQGVTGTSLAVVQEPTAETRSLALTPPGTEPKALTSTYTDNNATQIVYVEQQGTGYGLRAKAVSNNAVFAETTATSGTNFAIRGISPSTGGRGVFGYATAATGGSIGVLAASLSTTGTGVIGQVTAASGVNYGVRGEARSPAGIAGVFNNTVGGQILSGRGVGFLEKFSVDGNGTVVAAGGLQANSGNFITDVAAPYFHATASTGTPPMIVASTTVVENLNADMVDGIHGSSLATLGSNIFVGNQAVTGNISGTTGSFSGSSGGPILTVAQIGGGSAIQATKSGADAAAIYGTAAGAGLGSSGVWGENTGTSGIGVRGSVTNTTGTVYGVYGTTSSSSGRGVVGESNSSSGPTYGVYGLTSSTDSSAAGVRGGVNAAVTTGSAAGVYGLSGSNTGTGVLGQASNTGAGVSYGVRGTSSSDSGGTGVKGEATGTGITYGVHGTASSTTTNTAAVLGEATGASGTVYGVKGVATASAAGRGVEGVGSGGFGVRGESAGSGVAVHGSALFGGIAVQGISGTNIAGDFDREDGGGIILQARFAANIRFKVEGDGDVFADGTFTGGGADFAESVAPVGKKEEYGPGDVLTIALHLRRAVMKSFEPYSTRVAGIHSTRPAMLGRQWEMEDPRLEDEIPLAIIGIVPCKVSAENGAIEVGDLLVTSATPGHAMRGTDRSRMLGAIVGKALEPLTSGTGVVQVLVTLQ